MPPNNRKDEATRIVRQFSWDAVNQLPENPCIQAVASFERETVSIERTESNKFQEWQKWLRFDEIEPDNDFVELEKECKTLAMVWEDFKSRLPESERQNEHSSVPDISAVRRAVSVASSEWEGKKEKGFGKAKHNFLTFCERLDAHSQLFNVIPQGDKYTSIFTGVLSSIVKVSVRHNEIAEGFSLALAEISSDLKFSQRQNKLFSNSNMKRLVMTLYIQYFQFLCHAMKWYTSSKLRFRKAFNQKFYDEEVDGKVKKIKRIVEEIVKEASLESQGTVIATLETSTAIYDYVQQVPTRDELKILGTQLGSMERNYRIADENQNMVNRVLLEKVEFMERVLGALGQQSLVAASERHLIEQEQAALQLPWISSVIVPNAQEALALKPGNSAQVPLQITAGKALYSEDNAQISRQQLESDSRSLEKYINKSGVNAGLAESAVGGVQVAGEIVIRLQSWISGAKSQTLWIMGLTSTPSEATTAAAYVTAIASRGDIPCISYFCRFWKDECLNLDSSKTIPIAGLISLLYSLIRQLILLTPAVFEGNYGFRTSIYLLDGSLESIPQALEVLQALLKQSPRLLLCVIDGIQMIDQRSTNSYVGQLLDILQQNEIDGVRKVLFTTSGVFMSGMKVKFGDRLDCQNLPKKMPGRPQPGGRPLSALSSPGKP